MATFVPIHGGDAGWYWHLVQAELRTALREDWHVQPGRVEPPPGWGDLPG